MGPVAPVTLIHRYDIDVVVEPYGGAVGQDGALGLMIERGPLALLEGAPPLLQQGVHPRVGVPLGVPGAVGGGVIIGAQVVVGKEACTWKSVAPLTTKIIDDPGIKSTIRSWEVGQIQVVNANAICKITGV